jgi:hypothetical protein
LGLARASYYHRPQKDESYNMALINLIDEHSLSEALFMEWIE